MAIQRLITDKIKEYTDNIVDLQIEKKDFTSKSLIDKVNNPTKRKTVGELFQEQIQRLYGKNGKLDPLKTDEGDHLKFLLQKSVKLFIGNGV